MLIMNIIVLIVYPSIYWSFTDENIEERVGTLYWI